MCRVLVDEGVIVNLVPNRFWKLLHLILFYPSQLLSVGEILTSQERRQHGGRVESHCNNLKGDRRMSFFRRNIWPPVHGEYPNHWVEFVRLGPS